MSKYYSNSLKLFQNLSNKSKLSIVSKIVKYYNSKNNPFFSTKQKLFYDEIINEGWASICNYGLSIKHTYFSSYKFSADQYDELKSRLYLTYRKEIYKYNKNKGKPTTFFRPYFYASTREYINFLSRRPSHYYNTKLKEIDSATSLLKSLKKQPTIHELSEITKLSHTTINNALNQRNYHQAVALDKIYSLSNDYDNPETAFIHKADFLKFLTRLQKSSSYRKQFESNFSSKKLHYVYGAILNYAHELGIPTPDIIQ